MEGGKDAERDEEVMNQQRGEGQSSPQRGLTGPRREREGQRGE